MENCPESSITCPYCGNPRPAKIVYGLPDGSEEYRRRVREREIVSGGCLIPPGYPKYRCFVCGRDIFTSPVFAEEGRLIRYADRADALLYRVFSPSAPPLSLSMAKLPERVLAETRQGKEENETVRRFGIDPAAWDGLMDTLYSRLHLHEWPPAEGEPPEDGWQLKVSLRGGRVFTWAGGDGFPPYGAELKALFAPYLPDSGS